MKKLYTTDKTGWLPGEWHAEPDEVFWIDGVTGLPCLIVRALLSGALCGYVGVDSGHPYCLDEDDHPLKMHGGCTFEGNLEYDIINEIYEDRVFFGFDCSHVYDICPSPVFEALTIGRTEAKYRNFDYVKKEVENLARQLADKIAIDIDVFERS